MNKSRINCFLYMDLRLRLMELPPAPRAPAYIAQRTIFLSVEMNQCNALHVRHKCALDWEAWMEDHEGANMEDVYAAQTESEAEAEARLSDDDWGANSSFLTVHPFSSQGR
jgi:hypothetical protein